MKTVELKDVVGQQRVKDTLKRDIENGRVAHAYLFCGDEGVGKFAAALAFARALLCTGGGAAPCGRCESCRQVDNHTHPDFHCALPVCLAKEHRGSDGQSLNEKGWEFLDETCRKRVADPYVADEAAGIPLIPVEWIREINHAIQRGAVKSGFTVALICDIDLLNRESANAMLKTLEEPPADTLIICTTRRPFAVLPTLVSRCRIVRFGYIAPSDIAAACAARLGTPADDERIAEAARYAEGSLGRALRLLDQPSEECAARAMELLDMCRSADWNDIGPRLDAMVAEGFDSGRDYGTAEKALQYVMYVVRDSFLAGMGASEKYIRKEYVRAVTPGAVTAEQTEAMARVCGDAIAGVRARGNVLLVLAAWLISMTEILYGKEQQTR
jgi:DNA polymerase-3 subunit delta'